VCGVERLLQQKEVLEKKRNLKNSHQFQQQKSKSFIDIFYNYFTEVVNEEGKEGEVRSWFKQRQELEEVKKGVAVLVGGKEEDYDENIEEEKEDAFIKQCLKDNKKMQDLIQMICLNIKENMCFEEGFQCLVFILNLMSKTNSQDLFEKLWVEFHVLLSHVLKPMSKNSEPSQ